MDSTLKHSDGRRLWNKKHVCCFCDKVLSKMARHYYDSHTNEPEVRQALQYPKQSKERRLIIETLTRKGDYYRNLEILHLNDGHLFLLRKPTIDEIKFRSAKEYGPCPGCLGFLIKTELWRHCQNCEHYKRKSDGTQEKQRGQIQRDSRLLLIGDISESVSDEFKSNILATMFDDDISETVRQDWLIIRLGWYVF